MAPLPEAMGPGARRRRGAPAEPSESTDLRAIAADVRRVPPLRPGEQERLLQSISSTREPYPARERLLETHLAMVLAVATQKQGRGLGIGDLFQEGSVGLLRAIASYPASGRSDFDAYVRDQVALAIEDALAGDWHRAADDEIWRHFRRFGRDARFRALGVVSSMSIFSSAARRSSQKAR